MRQYLNLLQDIKDNGVERMNRTGVGTISVFGRQVRYDLAKGFPAVTTKKLYLRAVIHELLWFLKGSTNIKYLIDNDVHIWDEWPFRAYLISQNEPVPEVGSDAWQIKMQAFIANMKNDAVFAEKYGELGPVYGYQWRSWPAPDGSYIDQIEKAIDLIKNDPNSRRILVSAWNVADIDKMAKAGIPPCHSLFQFYVQDGKLSCQLYQRSGDAFLGVPFNIASYALLTLMMAQVTGLKPGEFIHTLGDVHIYTTHLEQVALQLSREPKKAPQMVLNKDITSIFDFAFEDFDLQDYDPHPAIKAPIAV